MGWIGDEELSARRRGKYNVAKKADRTADGIVFASRKEMIRYVDLKKQLDSGRIRDLEIQPKYAIKVKGIHICTYVADFRYKRGRRRVVEDVKGIKTPVYRLKKKLMAAVHRIEIHEV
jgi:hypothetical protein